MIRGEFPLLERLAYLNVGAAGLCPLSVAEKTEASVRAFELGGEAEWAPSLERLERGRARLAAFLGVTADEIAFTRNATEGINAVAYGLDWSRGGEVLISDEEHAALLFPWAFLAQRSAGENAVSARRFRFGNTPEETLDALEAALTPRTRLMAVSHVSCVTGKRAPAAEMARRCRERGVLSLIDGAQAAGQIPIQEAVKEADFYAGNGHKWLLGPKGTGYLRIRPALMDALTPTQVGAGSGSYDEAADRLALDRSARRFECGTRGCGRYAGFEPLFEWWDQVGFENAWRRMRMLTGMLKEGLKTAPNVRLHTPTAWEHSCAMSSFSVEGVSGERLAAELYEQRRIRVRYVEEIDGVRVSTALFNNEEEINRLIDAVRK